MNLDEQIVWVEKQRKLSIMLEDGEVQNWESVINYKIFKATHLMEKW